MYLALYIIVALVLFYCLFRFTRIEETDGDAIAAAFAGILLWPLVIMVILALGPPGALFYGIYRLAKKHRK